VRYLLSLAVLTALFSCVGSAQTIEDFETGSGWHWTPWTTADTGTAFNINGASARSGSYGASSSSGTSPWYYRTTPSVGGTAGAKIEIWCRTGGSGRVYMGYGASASGCFSLVFAPNTSNLIIQQNASYGFSDVASSSFTYSTGVWYRMELEWITANQVTGRLYLGTSTTASVSVTYNHATPQSGGVALRAFGPQDFDDFVDNSGFSISTQSPLPTAAEGQSYSTTIQAVNGTTPYTWNTNITGLPAGITASQPTGTDHLLLSGQPQTGTAGTYNFTVSASDSASANDSRQFTLYVTPPPTAMPFADDFSSDTGWQLGTGWQRGAATAYTGNTSTGPTRTEPDTDNSPSSDNMILGHNIGGDYTNSMAATYAVSPPINCTGSTIVYVRFYRWLGVNSGDWARIQVTNNGNTWTDVYTNNGTSGVNTPSQWEPVAYDISSVAAGNSVVQVRFQMGSTDGSIVNVGWCIDDFEVLDPGPPMVVEEGGVGGTVITDNEAVGGLRDWGVVNTSTNSSTLTVAFTNNGLDPITFGSYSKTGNDPAEFIVTKQITTNPLPVGQTDTMEFQFYSQAAGVFTATINVPHNVASGAGSSPFEINLRAEAVVPIPDLEVRLTSATGPTVAHNDSAAGTIRDFGDQDVNAGPTSPITIYIVNAGTGNLGISTPDMGGTWWNQYVVNVPGSFPSTLAPGASAYFDVQFDPTSTGVKDAFVRIAHTDGAKPSPYQVPVLGNGTNSSVPGFDASDSGGALAHDDPAGGPRDFGNVVVGTSSAPITITITNSGGQDLTLGNPTLGGTNPGEFTLDLTGYQTTVTSTSSTSFDVTFDPTSVGQKDATISITHNGNGVTSPFIINVTGNGVVNAPTASVHEGSAAGPALSNPTAATGSFDFGQQDINVGPTTAVTVYVESTGTTALTLGTPTLSGADAGEFVIQNAAGFAGTYNPGDPGVTFEIAFDPTSVGVKSAQVRFTHNDTAAGSPFVINVTGEGIINSPLIEVRETNLTGTLVDSGDPVTSGSDRDLGSIDVTAGATAPVTLYVINTGTLDLNLGTPSLAGANAGSFVLNTAGFNGVVNPGDNTSFQVSFDPNLGGIKDAQIEFTQDDPSQPSPYVIPIRGTAVDPNGVQITTASLPSGASGQPYGPVILQATQGTTPYVWSVYSGNLPAGLTLSPAGQIDGTPSGFGGTYNVTIRVEETGGATHERNYTIGVTGNLTGSGRAKSNACAAGSGSGSPFALLGVIGALGALALVRRRTA